MARKIANQSIVFYRKADGSLVALEDRCCHRSRPCPCGDARVKNYAADITGLNMTAAADFFGTEVKREKCRRTRGHDAG
jgi:hypothetical protein